MAHKYLYAADWFVLPSSVVGIVGAGCEMFSENNNKLCSSLLSSKSVACMILMSLVLLIIA